MVCTARRPAALRRLTLLFVELRFFLFFAVVLCVYWSLRSNDARKWFTLCASYYFYGSWDWRFAVMLFILSSLDWLFALRISESDVPSRRTLFVTLSLAMNLSVLAFFKYFHFFVGSAISAAKALHFTLDEPTLRIILPVGVSFFTFQSLSYTIDVYRREIQSTACATTSFSPPSFRNLSPGQSSGPNTSSRRWHRSAPSLSKTSRT